MPQPVQPQRHSHRCPKRACRHVWSHSDEMVGVEEAHKCPKCGTIQWNRYYRLDEKETDDG